MERRRSGRARSEITDRTDQDAQDMEEQEELLGETVGDIETVRGTLDSLNLGGTAEGSASVEEAIQGAKDGAVELYETQDAELESAHESSESSEAEVEEQADAVEEDLDRIGDAEHLVETSVARDGLDRASDVSNEDRDFLIEQQERARSVREASERAQQEFRRRASDR